MKRGGHTCQSHPPAVHCFQDSRSSALNPGAQTSSQLKSFPPNLLSNSNQAPSSQSFLEDRTGTLTEAEQMDLGRNKKAWLGDWKGHSLLPRAQHRPKASWEWAAPQQNNE